MKKGIIFSIEEFGINDGPGIRTVIFLKGCPLRCVWCHNPESISFEPQYLEKKSGRSLCGYSVDATELAQKMLKNKIIFEMGNGGVTLSGGEPLAQPGFTAEFLEQVAPVHRVVETSGMAPASVFREIVGLTDLTLIDVKQMNPEKHRQYTGASNRQILENIGWLCASGKPFVARIPLIPGVNDDDENLQAIQAMFKGVPSLQRIELMPYNKFAGAKYPMLGREYNPPFDLQSLHVTTDIFKNNNINAIVL
ncbi:MAG: radical SAM protein [Dysgonamonadaceae bacterium]|jgi:pyruvate formate lyase activating enzyme|nr:radical SAM protein [Dysgonamonadaceae bacterium]